MAIYKATTDRDEFLVTMYFHEPMKFAAFCDEDDCDRIDYLQNTLTEAQLSQLVDNYNLRTFGVTYSDCKKRKCLYCKDISICDRVEREAYERECGAKWRD